MCYTLMHPKSTIHPPPATMRPQTETALITELNLMLFLTPIHFFVATFQSTTALTWIHQTNDKLTI